MHDEMRKAQLGAAALGERREDAVLRRKLHLLQVAGEQRALRPRHRKEVRVREAGAFRAASVDVKLLEP